MSNSKKLKSDRDDARAEIKELPHHVKLSDGKARSTLHYGMKVTGHKLDCPNCNLDRRVRLQFAVTSDADGKIQPCEFSVNYDNAKAMIAALQKFVDEMTCAVGDHDMSAQLADAHDWHRERAKHFDHADPDGADLLAGFVPDDE